MIPWLLPAPDSILQWTFEVQSHFDAMMQDHAGMGCAHYVTDYPNGDMRTYAEAGWK